MTDKKPRITPSYRVKNRSTYRIEMIHAANGGWDIVVWDRRGRFPESLVAEDYPEDTSPEFLYGRFDALTRTYGKKAKEESSRH